MAEGRSADQMALEIEQVVDGGVSDQELLGRGYGLEFLLLSLPPSDREVRVFRQIVLPYPVRSMSSGLHRELDSIHWRLPHPEQDVRTACASVSFAGPRIPIRQLA